MLCTLYEFPLPVECLCRDLLRPLIQEMLVFSFFCLISSFLRLFQKMTCVLSSEHESQIVTIIGTLLHDINSCWL